MVSVAEPFPVIGSGGMKCPPRRMVERDCLQLGESLATLSGAEEDWELVANEFAAALGEDRRPAGETCAPLLAAAGGRASHAAAFWQHASKDRGAAAAGRVASQERQRSERSEVIPWREVLAARLVGGGKQTKPVSGTAQRAGRRGDPPTRGHGDLGLPREGGRHIVLREDGS